MPFAFDPASPQFRCQVTGLLLLTSVNFRWIVTQRLPSVPYLTSLDKYAICSLLFLVIFCVWHSLIGSTVLTTTNKKEIDTYVLYGFATAYIIFNVIIISWLVKMFRTIQNVKDYCQTKDIDDLSNKLLKNNKENSFTERPHQTENTRKVYEHTVNKKYSTSDERKKNSVAPANNAFLVQSA